MKKVFLLLGVALTMGVVSCSTEGLESSLKDSLEKAAKEGVEAAKEGAEEAAETATDAAETATEAAETATEEVVETATEAVEAH